MEGPGATGVTRLKEIGDLLRKRREELGISLAAAQAATKIRTRYLEAIENGEELSYPGEVYYRGFIKSYASFLGLDGAEIAARYRALKEAREREAQAESAPPAGGAAPSPECDVAAGPADAPSSPPAPTSERARARARRRQSSRQTAVLALVIAACGLVYFQWYRSMAPYAHRAAAPEPAARPAGGVSVEPPAPPAPSSPPAAAPGPGQPTTAPPTVGQTTGPRPAIEFTREEKSRSLTEISAKVETITLVGEVEGGQCWVRVEADGALVQEAMLQPGTTHEWNAGQRLYIRVGAPAVMKLRLNGVDLGRAGPEGPARDFVISAVRGD